MILGTPHMLGTETNTSINVILNDTQLTRVSETKFLGVIIDECLTWKSHIDCVAKTISRNIGVMNKLKYCIPSRILHTLYCSLILPYLSYGIIIWGDTCKTYLSKLEKLQKWAIRTISKAHYRSHTQPLFAKNKILKVSDMHSLDLGVFMYKNSTNDLPQLFSHYFTKRSDVHKYPTRFANNLNLSNNKKSFSDHGVRRKGPLLWNSLTKKIRDSSSVKHFRCQLKRSLLNKYENCN